MISLTSKAAEKLRGILENKGMPHGFLRVRVTAGGCSGMNLEFDLSDKTNPDDKVYETNGAKLVVDPKSEFFLYGSTIDYQSSLMKSGFIVDNPNAKTTCSCGTSFST